MTPQAFAENQIWAHRYGGTPEMNAHILIKKIEGKLYAVNKYTKVPVDTIKIDKNLIYFCGMLSDYYKNILKKEGYND